MEKTIVPLISFVGIIVSAAVAYAVSLMQGKRSQKQLERQIKEAYTGKLYEKRIEIYPKLYFILSNFGKNLFNNTLTPNDFRDASKKIDSWDSENALFCSPSTLTKLLELRRTFRVVNLQESNEMDAYLTKKLHEQIVDLEMNLRSEIGVLAADGFHVPENRKKIEVTMHR